jgi:hypothetical protein
MSLSFDRNAIADCTRASTTSQYDAEAEQAATDVGVTHFDRNVIVDIRATSSLKRYASSDGVHVQAKRLFCQNDAVEVGCRRTLPHQSPLVLAPNTSRGFRVGHSHPAIRWGVHTSSIHTCKRRYCATLLEAVMEACMQAPELSGASMTHAIELRRSE